MALIGVVAYGYQSNVSNTVATSKVEASKEVNSDVKASVVADDVTIAMVASDIALNASMSVEPNISNMATSARIVQEIPVSTVANIANSDTPQAIVNPSVTRDVQEHTVADGETVDAIAEKYGISKDTVKWANNLTGDEIESGKIIKILPTDGVTYTVKADDTVEKIAEKYKVSPERLVLFNDLELTGVKEGDSIILPSAELPEEERPGYVAPRANVRSNNSSSGSQGSKVSSGSFRGGSVGNKYVPRQCTWYAYERRAQSGRPVGSFWGNAKTWLSAARSNGYLVNKTPAAGAIFHTYAGYYGHVGYIESVDYANGTVTYSDMNGKVRGGIYRETISLAEAQSKWSFIH